MVGFNILLYWRCL